MGERTAELIQAFGEAITQTVVNLFGAQSVRATLRAQFPRGELTLGVAGTLVIAKDDAETAIKKWVAFLSGWLVQSFGYDFTEGVFSEIHLRFGETRAAGSHLMDDVLPYIPEGFLEKERIRYFSKEELAKRVLERTRELQELNVKLEETVRERTKDLVAANISLHELLQEMDGVGKILVRRDLELTRANARLEELDQIKSEFVSIAAHQLRTPLTGIRWSYQTILDEENGGLNPEQRRLLESGLSTTLRMVDLVNDLLSVARIEEGKFGIRLKKQPLTPMLERLVVSFAERARKKGVNFSFEIARDPSLSDIAFDEEKLGIVFDNLLDNAIKYTEPGGRVALRALREGDHVTVEITDTGIGISPGQLHRVFTKFFRADNALRLHTSGTGLGLYVVKNIVEKHDGTIEVKSNEGKGSIFRITLPVV